MDTDSWAKLPKPESGISNFGLSCFILFHGMSLLVPLLVVCFKLKCHALSCLTCRSSGAAVLGLRVAEKLWKAKFAKQIEVISLCWCKSGNFAIANRAHLGHFHATSDVLAICRPPEIDSTGAGTSKVFKWRSEKMEIWITKGRFGILWVGILLGFHGFPRVFSEGHIHPYWIYDNTISQLNFWWLLNSAKRGDTTGIRAFS